MIDIYTEISTFQSRVVDCKLASEEITTNNNVDSIKLLHPVFMNKSKSLAV